MLFDGDIGNVEDDLLEAIVERSDVFELLPFGQLVASDLFFVQGFESIDKSVLEFRLAGDVSAFFGFLVRDPPLMSMSIEITDRDRQLLLLGGTGKIVVHVRSPTCYGLFSFEGLGSVLFRGLRARDQMILGVL